MSLRSFLSAATALNCFLYATSASPLMAEYRNDAFGYAVDYPKSWHIEKAGTIFYIENFPPSDAVQGARLPLNGAAVKVLLVQEAIPDPHQQPATVEEWVARRAKQTNSNSERTLRVSGAEGVISVTEIRTWCCAVAPYQESTEWYFQVRHRMFMAAVTYWEGDRNADAFRVGTGWS